MHQLTQLQHQQSAVRTLAYSPQDAQMQQCMNHVLQPVQFPGFGRSIATRTFQQSISTVRAAARTNSSPGFGVPEGTRFFIVPQEGWGPDYPFSGEKMSVTMALYRARDIEHAIEITNGVQGYQGRGHSCGIYSTSDENIMKLANATYTSRVMVNQPQSASNSGNLWNGMRQTFSLGCGSWGGNATNNNITWRYLINETWVSKPLAKTKELPSDEALFGKDIIEALEGVGL